MATYQSSNGTLLEHDNDKFGFEDWIFENDTRLAQWQSAAAAHKAWQDANPSAHPSTANDAANAMFNEWVAYANAIPKST